MMALGDGSVSLWKYEYPDQRKIKVCLQGLPFVCGCESRCEL